MTIHGGGTSGKPVGDEPESDFEINRHLAEPRSYGETGFLSPIRRVIIWKSLLTVRFCVADSVSCGTSTNGQRVRGSAKLRLFEVGR